MTDVPIGSRCRNLRIAFSLVYLLIIAGPAALLPWSGAAPGGLLLARIGDALILVAFPITALQPVLSARLRVLDRCFGLDSVYIFHKLMGMTAGTILLGAVVFRFSGSANTQAWPGLISAGLLLVLVFTAFLYPTLGISYEAWRKLHNVLALAALTALFAQAWLTTQDKAPLQALVALYFVAGIAAYVHHRLLGPRNRRKNLYRVEQVRRETPTVWSLTLTPPAGTVRFDFLPGQFQFLTFNQGRGEEHPFTISSSPALPGVHTATIKESGDFTRGIGQVQPGDGLAVQAPFGRFSYLLHPDETDLVFIAGGIGITPLMSMLRHMRDTAAVLDVQLVYANRSEEEIVFREELEELAAGKTPRLWVTQVLSRPGEGWAGEHGRLDWPLLEKVVVGDIRAKAYYICGPPAMMDMLISTLIDKGVPSRQVRSERFAL